MSAVLLSAFTCGWITLPASFFIEGESGQISAPATVYLIDHPRGLTVFDSGFGPRWHNGSAKQKKLVELDDGSTVGTRLEAIGIQPGAVRWIVNSHLHADHSGGNIELPNATVVVQESEWEFTTAGADAADHRPDFDTGQATLRVRGEYDLYGDGTVVLFPSPGHTPGHQCVSGAYRAFLPMALLDYPTCAVRRGHKQNLHSGRPRL